MSSLARRLSGSINRRRLFVAATGPMVGWAMMKIGGQKVAGLDAALRAAVAGYLAVGVVVVGTTLLTVWLVGDLEVLKRRWQADPYGESGMVIDDTPIVFAACATLFLVAAAVLQGAVPTRS